jgi:serine/threonine protein kinase
LLARIVPFLSSAGTSTTGFIPWLGKCLTQGRGESGDDISPEIFERRLSVIQQFCALLDKLHSKGIIHEDIKPSNLAFDAANNFQFIDFSEAALESKPPPLQHTMSPPLP